MKSTGYPFQIPECIETAIYLENSVNEAAGMTKIERKKNGREFKVVI
jgi:hypothetical protein